MMGVLVGSVIATSAILLALAALHAYAQWTIRNIDQEHVVRVRSTNNKPT